MAINVNLRKINVKNQTTYTYRSVTGETFTIYPDEATGITLDIIHDLCRADNRIVDQNLKQARSPMTEAERRDIEAWREEKPENEPPRTKADFPPKYQRWNLPIDGLRHEDDDYDGPLDRDPALQKAYTSREPEMSPAVSRLREFIATLTERQQEFYRLVYIEEYTKAEAAKIMGITPQRATTLDHQIRENIEKRLNI